MRDDLSAPNLGQADRTFDAPFFWLSYRKVEQWMTRTLTKGPVSVSRLTADEVITDKVTTPGAVTADTLRLTNVSDLSLASTAQAFQIGPTTGINVAIDSNEIMARNNGTAATLFINNDGGLVSVGINGISTSGPAIIGGTLGVTGNTTLSTFTASGLFTLNGGQIAFPDTPVPSADPETLDAYKEGSWTPVYEVATGAFTTLTYTTQQGHYTRVGRLCCCTFRINTSSVTLGTASGQLRIGGLPFTPVLPAGNSYAGVLNYPAYSASWVTAWPTGGLITATGVLLYTRASTVANAAGLNAANMVVGATASQNDIIGQFFYTC